MTADEQDPVRQTTRVGRLKTSQTLGLAQFRLQFAVQCPDPRLPFSARAQTETADAVPREPTTSLPMPTRRSLTRSNGRKVVAGHEMPGANPRPRSNNQVMRVGPIVPIKRRSPRRDRKRIVPADERHLIRRRGRGLISHDRASAQEEGVPAGTTGKLTS